MERTIKFRAWNEDDEEMYEDVFLSQKIPDGQKGFLKGLGLNEHIQDATKSFVLMQFTGLVDKNGVELFERDIVQVRSFLGEIMGTYVLEYKLNAFNYYAPGKPEQALYFAQNLVEKIGNVHENKELLDQPQQ